MTTRPGSGAIALHCGHRMGRLCNLVRIVRTDGFEVLITDHDRSLHFEDRLYVPAVMSAMSAEQRDAALRTPDQELHGVIDGTTMLIPDLLGQRYRGAQVWHVQTDWKYPWLPIARHYKTVRSVRWNGLRFVARLDGITQVLERPAGGRFGGVATIECPYRYGDPTTCKKDLSAETLIGVRVGMVNDARFEVEFTAASWPGSWADEYFRDGEIEWLWGAPAFNGATTAATTATRLTQTGAGLTPGAHVGETVRITDGIGGPVLAYVRVTDNTADYLDYESTPAMAGYPIGQRWDVVPDAQNRGVISPVAAYTHATRRVELFADTPFDIQFAESGIARAGCNGLFSTCQSKGNSDNFGGNHLQPQPGDLLEVAQ